MYRPFLDLLLGLPIKQPDKSGTERRDIHGNMTVPVLSTLKDETATVTQSLVGACLRQGVQTAVSIRAVRSYSPPGPTK